MKNSWCCRLLLIGLGCLTGLSFSAQTPQALHSDARIQQVVFDPNNVVSVKSGLSVTTQIEFADDEVIKEVQNGDAAAWSSSLNPNLPNMIFLKPVVKDSETNMTIVTNHHVYYFELDGRGSAADSPVYSIRFMYPSEILSEAEETLALKTADKDLTLSAYQNPDKFNWDYSFNGDQTILPQHVFDDGKFTYLQWAQNQPIPAVFVVDNPEGKEAVVNVRMEGLYLIIEKIAPQFTLRLGESHVASLFNNMKIAAIRRGS
jgi:type IV secretion system protein VirB9